MCIARWTTKRSISRFGCRDAPFSLELSIASSNRSNWLLIPNSLCASHIPSPHDVVLLTAICSPLVIDVLYFISFAAVGSELSFVFPRHSEPSRSCASGSHSSCSAGWLQCLTWRIGLGTNVQNRCGNAPVQVCIEWIWLISIGVWYTNPQNTLWLVVGIVITALEIRLKHIKI